MSKNSFNFGKMASVPSTCRFNHIVDVDVKLPVTIADCKTRRSTRTKRPIRNKESIAGASKSRSTKSKPIVHRQLCRICLLEGNMVSMMSKIGNDTVADMFHSITSVQVDPEENLPLSICSPCHTKLLDCYNFRMKCLESNDILQYKIGKNSGCKSDSIIGSKIEKETQTCVDDYDIADAINITNDEGISTEEVYKEEFLDDDDDDNEIEFLEEDSYIEDRAATDNEVEKTIHRITSNFLEERKNQKSEWQFSCGRCSKNFYKLKSLRSHAKLCKKTYKGEFPCNQCKECFDAEYDLKIHSAVHVKGSQWKCVECKKEFKERSRFRRHIRRHMATMKRWACSTCGKTFAEPHALRRHTRVHTGQAKEKNFSCVTCDKKFGDSNQLKEHTARHTGVRPCACEVCGSAFASSRLLASHRRVHSDHMPYECAVCGKRFRMKAALTTHLRTHTGERPYICSMCGKSFIQASNLVLHMRVHTGEKPYSCEVCGRKFASGSSLSSHMRVHTGEKPYCCPICDKRFARTDMKAHVRLHTGERPFACTACPKRFVSAAALREHSLVHTDERRFQCTFCSEKYKKKIYLNNHINKVHNKDVRKVHMIDDNVQTINNNGNEGENVTLNADEIPLDGSAELILQDDGECKTDEEHSSVNYQNNSYECLNEVIVGDDIKYNSECEINNSESTHEGT